MRSNAMTALWLRTAMLWFLATLGFGMAMGVTQQFQYHPSHAHMGVLGWLSSSIFALIYALSHPHFDKAKGPRLQWAAHNLGVALMTGALFLEMRSNDGSYGPFIGLGGLIVIAAALWLVAMTWSRVTPAELPAE